MPRPCEVVVLHASLLLTASQDPVVLLSLLLVLCSRATSWKALPPTMAALSKCCRSSWHPLITSGRASLSSMVLSSTSLIFPSLSMGQRSLVSATKTACMVCRSGVGLQRTLLLLRLLVRTCVAYYTPYSNMSLFIAMSKSGFVVSRGGGGSRSEARQDSSSGSTACPDQSFHAMSSQTAWPVNTQGMSLVVPLCLCQYSYSAY